MRTRLIALLLLLTVVYLRADGYTPPWMLQDGGGLHDPVDAFMKDPLGFKPDPDPGNPDGNGELAKWQRLCHGEDVETYWSAPHPTAYLNYCDGGGCCASLQVEFPLGVVPIQACEPGADLYCGSDVYLCEFCGDIWGCIPYPPGSSATGGCTCRNGQWGYPDDGTPINPMLIMPKCLRLTIGHTMEEIQKQLGGYNAEGGFSGGGYSIYGHVSWMCQKWQRAPVTLTITAVLPCTKPFAGGGFSITPNLSAGTYVLKGGGVTITGDIPDKCLPGPTTSLGGGTGTPPPPPADNGAGAPGGGTSDPTLPGSPQSFSIILTDGTPSVTPTIDLPPDFHLPPGIPLEPPVPPGPCNSPSPSPSTVCQGTLFVQTDSCGNSTLAMGTRICSKLRQNPGCPPFLPDASTVCQGTTFTQTDSCGNQTIAVGTKDCCPPELKNVWTPDPSTQCGSFTQSNGCGETRTAQGTKPGCECINETWSPDPSTVCQGESFTQTSSCGHNRPATGTKPDCCSDTTWNPDASTVCVGRGFTQTSNCGKTRTAVGTGSETWAPDPSTVCLGVTFTQTSSCGHTRTATGTGTETWSLDPSTVCQGTSFTQTSNCGNTRQSTGTMAEQWYPDPATVCAGVSFTQKSNCDNSRAATGTMAETWSPSPATACAGESFTQVSNCGGTRSATGTKAETWAPDPSTTCTGVSFTQTSTCGKTRPATGTGAELWSPDPSTVCQGQGFTQKSSCGNTRQSTGTMTETWSPDPSTICAGLSFAQTSSCGNQRQSTGTMTETWSPDPSTICAGLSFAQTSSCGNQRQSTGTMTETWSPDPSTICDGVTFSQTSSCGRVQAAVGTKAETWSPDASTVCTGTSFIQSSTCGKTRQTTGTKTAVWSPDPSTVCAGIAFTQSDSCGHSRPSYGTMDCTEPCTDSSWSPDPSTVCEGDSFIQTSNCGHTRNATGTKAAIWTPDPATICAATVFTQSDGCGHTRSSTGTMDCTEPCTDTSWSPDPSTICAGDSFIQVSNCGHTRSATGTLAVTWSPNPATVCAGLPFTQVSSCGQTRQSTGTKDCTSPCTDLSWNPDPSTVCAGDTFTQVSNCGHTRTATGTMAETWSPDPSTVCAGLPFTQTSSCGNQRASVGSKVETWSPDPSTICEGQTFMQTSSCGNTRTLTGTTTETWSPDPSTMCSGIAFQQTSSCGGTRQTTGTKPETWGPDPSTICAGQQFTQTSSCGRQRTAIGTLQETWSPDPATICEGTQVTQTSSCGNHRTITGTMTVSWSPDPATVCEGQDFIQTSTCGSTRPAVGTMPIVWSPLPEEVCAGTTFAQTSNCGQTRQITGTKDCIDTCTDTSWSPDPGTVCFGQTFTQTSNCGHTRPASGVKDCCSTGEWTPDPATVCAGQSFTQSNGCGKTRAATGTKPETWSPDPATLCAGDAFEQISTCGNTRQNVGTKQDCCTSNIWSPDPSTICAGQTYQQANECGRTREATGTKQDCCDSSNWLPDPASVCSGTTFLQVNDCGNQRQAVGTKNCCPDDAQNQWTPDPSKYCGPVTQVNGCGITRVVTGSLTNCCIDGIWLPDPATVCAGTQYTQTSDCGRQRPATGTKACDENCPSDLANQWSPDPAGYCGPVTQVNQCGQTRIIQGTQPRCDSCTDSSWLPDAADVCYNQVFIQTSNCGHQRTAVGTGNQNCSTICPPDKANTWTPDPSAFCGPFTQINGCGQTRTTQGTMQGCCQDQTWEPDPAQVCVGKLFTQVSNCGNLRQALGTNPGTNWYPDPTTACQGTPLEQANDCGQTRMVTGLGTNCDCTISWGPSPSTICLGTRFYQTNNCNTETRPMTGTKPCDCLQFFSHYHSADVLRSLGYDPITLNGAWTTSNGGVTTVWSLYTTKAGVLFLLGKTRADASSDVAEAYSVSFSDSGIIGFMLPTYRQYIAWNPALGAYTCIEEFFSYDNNLGPEFTLLSYTGHACSTDVTYVLQWALMRPTGPLTLNGQVVAPVGDTNWISASTNAAPMVFSTTDFWGKQFSTNVTYVNLSTESLRIIPLLTNLNTVADASAPGLEISLRLDVEGRLTGQHYSVTQNGLILTNGIIPIGVNDVLQVKVTEPGDVLFQFETGCETNTIKVAVGQTPPPTIDLYSLYPIPATPTLRQSESPSTAIYQVKSSPGVTTVAFTDTQVITITNTVYDIRSNVRDETWKAFSYGPGDVPSGVTQKHGKLFVETPVLSLPPVLYNAYELSITNKVLASGSAWGQQIVLQSEASIGGNEVHLYGSNGGIGLMLDGNNTGIPGLGTWTNSFSNETSPNDWFQSGATEIVDLVISGSAEANTMFNVAGLTANSTASGALAQWEISTATTNALVTVLQSVQGEWIVRGQTNAPASFANIPIGYDTQFQGTKANYNPTNLFVSRQPYLTFSPDPCTGVITVQVNPAVARLVVLNDGSSIVYDQTLSPGDAGANGLATNSYPVSLPFNGVYTLRGYASAANYYEATYTNRFALSYALVLDPNTQPFTLTNNTLVVTAPGNPVINVVSSEPIQLVNPDDRIQFSDATHFTVVVDDIDYSTSFTRTITWHVQARGCNQSVTLTVWVYRNGDIPFDIPPGDDNKNCLELIQP